MRELKYEHIANLASYFIDDNSKNHFSELFANEVINLYEKNANNKSYIPPVYCAEGYTRYNVDWNFLAGVLAKFVGDEKVKEDLYLEEGQANIGNIKFVLLGVFGCIFPLALVSFSAKSTLTNVFVYSQIVVERNGEKRKFSAVGLAEKKLCNYLSTQTFERLKKTVRSLDIEQIAFGTKSCSGIDCKHV